jgi:hypothetical protein
MKCMITKNHDYLKRGQQLNLMDLWTDGGWLGGSDQETERWMGTNILDRNLEKECSLTQLYLLGTLICAPTRDVDFMFRNQNTSWQLTYW